MATLETLRVFESLETVETSESWNSAAVVNLETPKTLDSTESLEKVEILGILDSTEILKDDIWKHEKFKNFGNFQNTRVSEDLGALKNHYYSGTIKFRKL